MGLDAAGEVSGPADSTSVRTRAGHREPVPD